MQPAGEDRVETALKMLIRHLVLSFPQAGIFSRPVGHAYQVFVIAPYDGGPDKAIQVERAWLAEQQATIDEFQQVLESLNLPTVLERCERYELRPARGSAPANAGWPAAPGSRTVAYGPFQLSSPPLSTSPGALLPLRPD